MFCLDRISTLPRDFRVNHIRTGMNITNCRQIQAPCNTLATVLHGLTRFAARIFSFHQQQPGFCCHPRWAGAKIISSNLPDSAMTLKRVAILKKLDAILRIFHYFFPSCSHFSIIICRFVINHRLIDLLITCPKRPPQVADRASCCGFCLRLFAWFGPARGLGVDGIIGPDMFGILSAHVRFHVFP